MGEDLERSLGDAATFAGKAKRPPSSEMSLGDERTLGGGGGAAGVDTVIDDIEVVDLEARYKIEGTLGQGGMGTVLLATDTRLDRKVAIKRILSEAVRSKAAIARFLTEARAIAAISHPNVVQIYELGVAKDGLFLVIEYIDGGSLLDRCKSGPIPQDEAVSLVCQACDGLAKAHDLGIIHRDIKPANVLLTKDGIPKLTDFGLAKAQAGDHGQTTTGAVLGTPDFMPPEQRHDASLVDHRSDLWSLAATLYQAVSGRSPKVIRLHELPAELQPIIGKALEDEKESRYQSAKEFRDALKGIGAVSRKQAAPAHFEGVLQEGQCKACGTVASDLTRKFCRNPQCRASLRVACLKCDAQIPVWDAICGECGGNQPALLAAKRESLATARAEAEALLAGFAFDEAIARARPLADEASVDLADFAAWGGEFVASATVERDRQRALGEERLHAAHAHFGAWDYPAAIQALESIPASLRDAATTRLLEQCGERKRESDELIATIASRIGRKEIDGLLPVVERAIALRGDRLDLAKVRRQLAERLEARITRARAALAGADGVLGVDDARRILQSGEEFLAVNPASEKTKRLVTRAREIVERDVRQRCEAEEQRQSQESHRQFIRAISGKASVAEVLALPPLSNSIGIELKLLPAGTFTRYDFGELYATQHQVTLTKPFYMGVYEVTNAQWKRVMRNLPPSEWRNDDLPVQNVSWDDAVQFCWRLSYLAEERKAGRVYRLPTEAEWEYACRAGTTTGYSFGDEESRLSEYGWFNSNSESQPHPVGTKKPNSWGLFDMHGNVWEWCSDWKGNYPKDAVTDPQGPSRASVRVFRGGSWYCVAQNCLSAKRSGFVESYRYNGLGFRLALSLL